MAQSIPAIVKPRLLIWARERAGFRLEEAAAKTQISLQDLRGWESGSERPSIAQLRKLAAAYNRSLAVFFLSDPPKDFDPQREFRRIPGVKPKDASPELRQALRTAWFRREAMLGLYNNLGDELPSFNALARLSMDTEAVGQRMRHLLNIAWEKQIEWSGEYAALDGWRSEMERHGILVFQTSKVKLSEMRGTSTPSGPLPVILLNNTDSPVGRIFTLLHEFAHLLLTNGGYQTSESEGKRRPEDRLLEQASNSIAAAALMPKVEFLAEAARYRGAAQGDDNSLRKLAMRIKVSPEAILRRLVTLQVAKRSTYLRKRRLWLKRRVKDSRTGEGGPPIEVRVVAAAGRPFVSMVLDGYQRKILSSSDVSDHLGIQLKYLDRVAKQLAPGPGRSALE